MLTLVKNKCGYPNCWNYDCDEWCPHYKPRLFGFIPVTRKFGEWLSYLELKIFFKFYKPESYRGDDFDDMVSDD